MKFDICLPNSVEGLLAPSSFAGVEEMGAYAREAENLGYHAIWGFDFINPACRTEIPRTEAPQWYELMTTLAYVSALTQRIRLVAGVVVLPNRDPIVLAKQVATVDQFSRGRLDLGIGLGWRKEFETLQPRERLAHRGRMLDEKLEALQMLLHHENEPISYQGRYVEFDNVILYPKPMQNPLPMFTAAESPAPLRRAAKWGLGPIFRDKDLEERRAQFLPLLEEHGRRFEDIDVMVWADISIKSTTKESVDAYINSRMGQFRQQDAARLLNDHWIGTVEEVAEKIIRIKRQGIGHVVAMHVGTDTYTDYLEQTQIFAEEVMPLVESA